MFYKLDENKNAIPCGVEEWCKIFDDKESRRVAYTQIDGYEVSTVFLGVDHNHFGGTPILFETMIFGPGDAEEYQTRCSTWQEAVDMHSKAICWLKNMDL